MTPQISPTLLRELAVKHMADKPPFVEHLYESCQGLRAAADRLEAYECLQVSTRAAHDSLRKELDAAKARIEELERDEGIVMVGDGLRCGPEKVTCLLLERDELRKELDAAKAAHDEEAGRWNEQHAHQHAVNTRLARRNALLEHAFAAAKELQFDYDPEYGASHAIIENFLKALEACDREQKGDKNV